VDNRSDGSVEMEVQGGPLQLQRLLSRLKGQFDIDRIDVTKKDPIPHERGFRVRGY
jgi:acylphosphatase